MHEQDSKGSENLAMGKTNKGVREYSKRDLGVT